ncbi:MAG: zf-HC2 domain-containing protein [Tissierellia bacterium]|nr:zf-HC2 domain-containing protein [Tissierellia bacterium]
MKDCKIVRDLMPLVVDDLASEESIQFIKEHLKDCKDCEKYWNEISKNDISLSEIPKPPIKMAREKIKKRKMKSVIIAISAVLYLFLIVANFLLQPISLSATEAGIVANDLGEQIEIGFNNNYKYFNYAVENNYYNDEKELTINAWRVRFSNQATENNKSGFVIDKVDVDSIWYTSKDMQDILLYGKSELGNRITLPRLILNYYFHLIAASFIVSSLLYYFMHKKIFKYIAILACSYIIAHFSIMGKGGPSYFIKYHLSMIILTTLPLSILIYNLQNKFFNEKLSKKSH